MYTALHKEIKYPEQRWSNFYIQELKHLVCAEAMRRRLDMLLMDLDYARWQTCFILKKLRTFCEEQSEIQKYLTYLQSIPGVGFITAATVLANIGDPKDLTNIRELAGFLGLAPSEHSTGDVVSREAITHLGNRILRTLLIEASGVAIRNDQQRGQFYHRSKAKQHTQLAARKASVAVARKLTQIIYGVLKEQRNYIKR